MKKRCLNKLLVMTMAAAIGFGTGGRYITVYAEENALHFVQFPVAHSNFDNNLSGTLSYSVVRYIL